MTVIANTIPPGEGRECVLLLSGGLDSTTLLAALRAQNWSVHAITFRYGQKHEVETEAAVSSARRFGCRSHKVLRIPLSEVAASAITRPDMEVPRGGTLGGIPPTYVPARNLVFLSIAVSWAESLGVHDIFIATSSVDYSGYPDCRQEFIDAFQEAARRGTKKGMESGAIRVHAPFTHLSKKEIVLLGLSLGVDYAATKSCYSPSPGGVPCGSCDACLLRAKGFAEAGATDPATMEQR